MVPRGVRPTPPESRNGGTVTYHPWQRNETLRARPAQAPARAHRRVSMGDWKEIVRPDPTLYKRLGEFGTATISSALREVRRTWMVALWSMC